VQTKERKLPLMGGGECCMHWKPWTFPTGQSVLIPADIPLELPASTSLEAEHLHFLVTLPWKDAYLRFLDRTYMEFFQALLPYVHARTTDVHVATCFPFLKEFIDEYQGDEQVVSLAFLLHDSGWSQMTDREIAASLDVPGLALSASAMPPKAKHALLGCQIAMHVLEQEPPAFQLTHRQKQLIYAAILYHDQPWKLAAGGSVPVELKIVCDVDHLWSFTHENFWQDVVRKQVHPVTYAENLEQDLASYFVTEKGRTRARSLLSARQYEVEAWSRQL